MSVANVNVTKILMRRGNTAQNAVYTGVNGEVTVDLQVKTLRIHDGVTQGGTVITAGGVVGAYSNTNAAAYIPTDPTITSIQANVTAANASIPNLLAISSNILPSANITYSLGSSTRQWRDLWVSNNTIYIGNVPLTVSNGNLLVNGSLVTGSGSGTDDVLRANVGAYQTFANANAATQATSINTVNANIGAYQTFANSNAATQSTAIATLQTQVYANANVNTYLSSSIIGSLSTSGNLTVGGNLVVNGNSTIINTTSYTIEDNILQIADGNPADTLDLGFVGHRTVASTLQHTGLVRDASAGNWRLFSNVTAQPGNTIDFTNAIYDDLVVGNISANIVKNNYTWTFGTDGNLTVPASGTITAPNAQEFQLQARDTNSLLRNEINLDPNNGTYMSVWSEELETSFSTSDWATGLWENLAGVPGISGAFFTNAENLQDFWTTGSGSFVNSVEVSINGGARLPVSYDGNNGETYGALLLLTGVPATSPTTITSLTFYYRTQSSIDIDYNVGEILLDAQSIDIDLRTTNNLDLRAGQNLNIRGTGQYPVRIYTDDTTHKWEFDNTGSLTLPREGKIYGIGDGVAAGDRYGYISWAGNSSGDGSGFNTMRLVPDLQGLEDLDQYIIIDPTGGVPGHIHIRAGGTQDNSLADLYLGGEHSHVKIGAGANPPITVMANDNSWNFGANANLTLPETGYLRVGTGIVAGFASSPAPIISGFGNISATNYLFANGVNILSTVTPNFGNTIAIGYNTGTVSQGSKAVAVGSTAGNVSQGTGAVAVGDRSGVTSQGNLSVAVGSQAGEISQGLQATAVGSGAGNYNQSAGTVAIGTNAGAVNQGLRAVAVGSLAGSLNQGEYAVALGNFAGGTNQGNNSIIINATGSSLDQTTANTFTVAPVRNDVANVAQVMFYNTTSKEITYGNTISVAGNINASQFNFANGVNILSTVGAGSYGNTQVAAYLLTYTNANISTLNSTSGNVTTLRAVNFNSANAVITSGYITALTNANIITGTITTLNSTSGNATTLVATNFSTANAVITGGYATGLANLSVTGNVTVGNLIGASPNTTIIAGSYSSTFDIVGNVVLPNVFINNDVTGGNISSRGTLTSTGKIGYASGTTVVQATSRGTGVTINTLSGNIALVSASIAAGAFDVLYVNNNRIDPTSDLVLVNLSKGSVGTYMLEAQPSSAAGAGFWLTVRNVSGSNSSTENLHVRFVVIKAPEA